MHGALGSTYSDSGELLTIGADIIKTLKDSHENSILVDAGDSTQGTPLASFSKGRKIYEIMKAAGWDFVALGNHEFDYGSDNLLTNISETGITALASNVYNLDGSTFLKNQDGSAHKGVIKEVAGRKIGFFGITTTDTIHSTQKTNIKNLVFKDEKQTSLEEVKQLKEQGAEVIVAITHTVNDEIVKIDGIDFVIHAHSHEVYSKKVGETLVAQTGQSSSQVGELRIEFRENKPFFAHRLISRKELGDSKNAALPQIPPDPNIQDLYSKELKKVKETLSICIGRTPYTLFGGNINGVNVSRLSETNAGNLLADAILFDCEKNLNLHGTKMGRDMVALVNGGSIRNSILAGDVTIENILNLTFSNDKVVAKLMTPKELYEVLESGFKDTFLKDKMLQNENTAFPNVGGMRLEIDANAPGIEFDGESNEIIRNGSKVKKVVLIDANGTDKQVLSRSDNRTQIIVCIQEFVKNGGDQYFFSRKAETLNGTSSLPMRDISKNYMQYLESINKKDDYSADKTHIKFLNAAPGSNYNVLASINNGGYPLANSKIKIRADNKNESFTTTDENGNAIVTGLSSGPHSLSISYGNHDYFTDVYVNNMLGMVNTQLCLNLKEDDLANRKNSPTSTPAYNSPGMLWWLKVNGTSFNRSSIILKRLLRYTPF
jgi:2',3'-cyclic-nucleotide 2'-phosphodiesterase (5'-nucleotidase family)